MLLHLLVKFWLFPIIAGDSWECSYEQIIYSVRSHHSGMSPPGMLLKFSQDYPFIVHHPCTNIFFRGISPALYLGKKVFISFDMFQSSLFPLTIPNDYTKPPAIISAAVFGSNAIVAVVNGDVFIYLYATRKRWVPSKGIIHPVTELSNSNCCYAVMDPVCDKLNELVLAYNAGSWLSTTEIYYSINGGYIFQPLKNKPLENDLLLGIYVFAASGHLGMLLRDDIHSKTAYFKYGDLQSLVYQVGTPFISTFSKGDTIESTHIPGMKGFILLWTGDTLMSSANDGLTTDTVTVIPTVSYSNKTLPDDICFVTASVNEIAVLSKTQLFYGILDMVSGKTVHLGNKNITSGNASCDAMLFENIGTLSIIHPFPSDVSKYYHFQKCIFNVQAKLMTVEPPLQPCPMEILSGDFHNRMYYIDTKQILYLNATFVPKPGTDSYPYVMMSNPHMLIFHAYIVEDGYTFNGNTKYKLIIKLEEQQTTVMLEKHNTMLLTRLSSVSVDIYNKGIFCIDMHPLTALIAVECPPKKHIRILRITTACSKGLFEPRLLENFVYSIDKKLYDPLFLGRKNLEHKDLNVTFQFDIWGCPLLLYYDKPWLPDLELWDNDEFVEYVSADFVLYEINGIHNYDYLLTEVEANCLSEAQNWTKQLAKFPGSPHIAWTRLNYESCKVPRGNTSLPSLNSKYQVLNRDERNRILFPQDNGFYVFRVTVVDSLYSHCDLSTIFSVYVYGARPKSEISVGKALLSILVLIFGTMLIVYFLVKLLKEHHSRMKEM